MSQHYKYNFVSPAPLIALIYEELKSYIDTGAIDSAIWSLYIVKCLKKLGRGSFTIKPTIVDMHNFEGRLPDDFYAVREAWACDVFEDAYQSTNADYQQVSTSTLLNPSLDDCYCDNCTPNVIKAVYKTTHQVARQWTKQYLLKPGNINCSEECLNFNSSGPESFDINGNKLLTTFREGIVYMLYYSKEMDEDGYPLIPDNYRIQEFIEAFIKQKVFEQLSNQVVDETYNQIQSKAQYYKQQAEETYISAQIESKMETVYDKHRKILRIRNRFNIYKHI